ncbi:MAG TPA: class D beta-lactamase [Devosia sp.]|nr:class D beta-lactamase [Devosia sp.]
MLRALAALLALAILATPALAAPACLLIADARTGETIHHEGADCDTGIGPASTFKLTLSVIGFDAGILVDSEHPALPYRKSYQASRAIDRQTVTPRTWMRDSVLWYSRLLVKELGAERFAASVAALDYGNADVSGEPGANNGLTHSWLNTSLLISPAGQLQFVRRLVLGDLPVSPEAMTRAIEVTPRFEAGAWQVQGKTGTGYQRETSGRLGKRQYGWFVGWATRGDRTLAFAYLIRDEKTGGSAAGPRARDDLLARWSELAGD